MKKGSVIQLAGGIALAAAGLYIFLRDVNIRQLWCDLHATPAWAVAACVGLTVLTLWLRTIRWNFILPASPAASRKGLFGIVMIGFMVNNFLPARLGEAARMLLLWKRNRFTVAESVGSVVLERIMDIVMFAAFFFVPVLFLAGLRPLVPYAIPIGAASMAAVAAFLLYGFLPSQTRALGTVLLKLVPARMQHRAVVIARELISNLNWVFSPARCAGMLALSFCTVACHAVMMVILVHNRAFTFLAGMFASACAAIGAAIPLSPGYVGTLHAALKQGLVLNGIDSNQAIAVAAIYHAIGYLTVTVLGLYYYLRLRISFRDIESAKKELSKEEGKGE